MNIFNDHNDTDAQLDELLRTTEDVLSDIEQSNDHVNETLSHLQTRVDASIAQMETVFEELNEAEALAEETLDMLILEEVEDVAKSAKAHADE